MGLRLHPVDANAAWALALGALLGACGGRQFELFEIHERLPVTEELQGCEAPVDYEPCFARDDEPLAAVGLACGDDPSRSIPLLIEGVGELAAHDPDTWRIVSHFGRSSGTRLGDWRWAPRLPTAGHNVDDRLLLLSTGRLAQVGPEHGLIQAAGSQANQGATANPDGQPLPAPIEATPGCDGVHDCSESLASELGGGVGLHDQISLRALIEVPPGTGGLALDLALFSAEFPEFLDSPFRDLVVVWTTSELFTGNLALVDGRALTISNLAEAGWMAHVGDDPALSGTGFEGHGSSPWMTLRAPVVAGESVELVVALADVGDSEGATVVALDDLRWQCERCESDVRGGCGLWPE